MFKKPFIIKDVKCKNCKEKIQIIAVWLYSHRLSFRAIVKLLKFSARSVFVLVKQFAKDNYSKPFYSHSQHDLFANKLEKN